MMAENKGIFSKVLASKKLDYFAEISYAFYIMQSFCSNFLSCFLLCFCFLFPSWFHRDWLFSERADEWFWLFSVCFFWDSGVRRFIRPSFIPLLITSVRKILPHWLESRWRQRISGVCLFRLFSVSSQSKSERASFRFMRCFCSLPWFSFIGLYCERREERKRREDSAKDRKSKIGEKIVRKTGRVKSERR